jgi:hypothetical protein
MLNLYRGTISEEHGGLKLTSPISSLSNHQLCNVRSLNLATDLGSFHAVGDLDQVRFVVREAVLQLPCLSTLTLEVPFSACFYSHRNLDLLAAQRHNPHLREPTFSIDKAMGVEHKWMKVDRPGVPNVTLSWSAEPNNTLTWTDKSFWRDVPRSSPFMSLLMNQSFLHRLIYREENHTHFFGLNPRLWFSGCPPSNCVCSRGLILRTARFDPTGWIINMTNLEEHSVALSEEDTMNSMLSFWVPQDIYTTFMPRIFHSRN